MNSLNFLRFMTKTGRFWLSSRHVTRAGTSARVIKPLSCSTMSTVSISQSKEKETFQDVLPLILDNLVTSPKFAEVPEVGTWIKRVLEYNLAGGKKNRGVSTVFAYEMSEKPENITEENMRLARILGWCVEMMQAYFLVVDDIMDGASSRRGVPCWYRLPDVGLGALNDAILIYQSIYEIINTHFSKMPQYVEIVDLFNECVLYTSCGQHLDYTMAHRNKNDYSMFTLERFETIVKYKTAFYTFRLPVFLGMTLANINDESSRAKANRICLEIGKFFQMQDDYIDCFSDEKVSGKAGTDIQEGKCCWLAVTALQLCNPAQRAVFEQCYGTDDPSNVKQIKQLYEDLNLPQIYKEQERAKYEEILKLTQELSRSSAVSPKLFTKLLDMIYNRRH